MTYRSPQRRGRTWDHALEDESTPVLEVAVSWRETQLHVEHGARSFSIADPLPEPHGALVTLGAEGFVLHVPPGARGTLDVAGVVRPVEESDADVRLALGDDARIELSGFTYAVAVVARGRPRVFVGRSFARAWTVLVSLVAHAVALLALSQATRDEVEDEEQGIGRETQRYFLDLMANVYRDEPYWIPERPGYMKYTTPDTCRPKTWLDHTMYKTVEKKVAIAWGTQHGAWRALQMAFIEYHPEVDGFNATLIEEDSAWSPVPEDHDGDRAYRRMVFLEHGDWDETLALGPPPPPRAYVATVRPRRRWREPPLELEVYGAPMVRKVLLARGRVLRECFPEGRTEPMEATLVAQPDGSVTDVMADACVHEALAETRFFPSAEACPAKVRMHRDFR